MQPPEPVQFLYLQQTGDRHDNDGGQDRLRQVAEQAGEEERDDENDPRGDQARERGARAAAFIDQRLRHAAADRKTLADARRQIRPGESEKLLVAIEAIAMFLGKHPPDRCRLDRAEEKTGERQRK